MRSFLDDWARDIRERRDGYIHKSPALWARLPLKARWVSRLYRRGGYERPDFEGHTMVLIHLEAVRCPDRERALAAGGAAPTCGPKDKPRPYYTAPMSTCRKCEHRVRSRIHRCRKACALLREAAKGSPSVAEEIGGAIQKAQKDVKMG